MKRLIVLLFWASLCTSVAVAQPLEKLRSYRQLRSCDLLFCLNPKGNAITDVTEGYAQWPIDHVGIYHRGQVIEATPGRGVCLTPIDSFIRRNGDMVVVGRVKGKLRRRQTIRRAMSYLHLPYDSLYLPDDSAIYCSELVQKSFVGRHRKPVFQPIPMSFSDASGRVTDYWKAFYQRFGMDVPEGLPGTNPGELSRRECVRLLFVCVEERGAGSEERE